MAISSTTFEQRIARINKVEAAESEVHQTRSKQRRSLAARCLTFPFIVGVSILSGGAAYAWAATQDEIPVALMDLQWVLSLAG
ncbi:hypothetical protein AB2B41_20420 [Marimonas sp. MJW-29]|uniref:Uncharacterized protein n=1 Tax=Sulfitobacter sediminis TaxID=3234186 RepID=A0ABV3RTV0_9RHOB